MGTAAGASDRVRLSADEIRKDPPLVHDQGNNCFSLSLAALRWLEQRLEPSMRTVETGCGSSTVLFAGSGADHTVVTPAEAEHDRLRLYCAERGVDASNVTFMAQPSHEALRHVASDIDLALLDGAHGYPYPIIDWFLIAPMLKVGGHVLIDDSFIPAVRSLVNHLDGSAAWSAPTFVDERAVAFQRLEEGMPPFDQWRGLGGRVSFSYLPLRRRPPAWLLFLLRANASRQPIKRLNEIRHRQVAGARRLTRERPRDRAGLEERIHRER